MIVLRTGNIRSKKETNLRKIHFPSQGDCVNFSKGMHLAKTFNEWFYLVKWDSSGMILGHLERMFNELLPHIPAFQVSILSRRNKLILESCQFCKVTTKGVVTILLMIAWFTKLPIEVNWVLWNVLQWIILNILNHELFKSCNIQDWESESLKLQFGELNHIVAEYHYKCSSKIGFYFSCSWICW